MSDYRLKLTIDESRHLFQSMMKEMRQVVEDTYSTSVAPQKDGNTAQSKAHFDEIWPKVESELRKAYELCRFALKVEDMEDNFDLDEFRGYCEDYDGITPVDDHLFEKISHEVNEINKALETRAIHRNKIPQNVEHMFMKHVKDQRQVFDSLLDASPSLADTPSVEIDTYLNGFPPEDLGKIANELVNRLNSLKNQTDLLVDDNDKTAQ